MKLNLDLVCSLMFLVCHKKTYLIYVEFWKYYVIFISFQAAVSALLTVSLLLNLYVEKNQNKYYVIFIYFQAAVSALLTVSVLYVKKNQNKYYVIFQNFNNSTH